MKNSNFVQRKTAVITQISLLLPRGWCNTASDIIEKLFEGGTDKNIKMIEKIVGAL